MRHIDILCPSCGRPLPYDTFRDKCPDCDLLSSSECAALHESTMVRNDKSVALAHSTINKACKEKRIPRVILNKQYFIKYQDYVDWLDGFPYTPGRKG